MLKIPFLFQSKNWVCHCMFERYKRLEDRFTIFFNLIVFVSD